MLGATRHQHSIKHAKSAKIIPFPEVQAHRREKEIMQIQNVLLVCEARRQDGRLLTEAECWKAAEKMHTGVIEKLGQSCE